MRVAESTGGSFAWWRESSGAARRALFAASVGWMLDSFDVMLFALLLPALMLDLGLSRQTAGVLGSLTLVTAAVGGVIFGFIADRFGRTRALIGSMLLYAFATAACGFAQNVTQLAVFRAILGFGMGGEWASGAALVAETWSNKHRSKALGIMQSSWAIGYALAALATGVLLPWKGWRAVFFVGIAPAVIALILRRKVQEPELWRTRTSSKSSLDHSGGLRSIFLKEIRKTTIAVTCMNACTLFAWWGFNSWIPSFLSLPRSRGGVGLSVHAMSAMVIAMQFGMWCGYISFGFLSDVFGRRRCYLLYLGLAAMLATLYGRIHSPLLLLLLGPLLAFFGTGYFSGFATITAELYETRVRATAQGFTYNLGRLASAAAPFTVGSLTQTHGFAAAFTLCGTAFLVAAILWLWIPETKGLPFG
ncbi:MAG: MFS transporter [Acidobacteriaceae bacterium]